MYQQAALVLEEDPKDPQFKRFYYLGDYSSFERYVRALAYNGMGVKGSDFFLSWPEMVRYSVEKDDMELFGYCSQNNLTVGYLLSEAKIGHLLGISGEFEVKEEELTQLLLLSIPLELEKLLKVENIIALGHPLNYHIQKYLQDLERLEEGGPITCLPLLITSVLQRKGNYDQKDYRLARGVIAIIDNNIKILGETDLDLLLPLGNLLFTLIAHSDNPETAEILISKTEDPLNFILQLLTYSNFGSNIMTYLLEVYHLQIKKLAQLDLTQLVKRKLEIDFAGLATIVQTFSPGDKMSFFSQYKNNHRAFQDLEMTLKTQYHLFPFNS